MNVNQIILKGIKEQLFLNDYLVIPNFGGFVLRKSPAHFSAGDTLLMPPAKTVGFNAQLKQNDGVFMQWLQAQLKCNGPQALAHLNDFAEYCKSLLNNRGRLTIDGIGFFYTDFENNICFEPQQQANFLTGSFGLTPIAARELEIEIEIPQTTQPVFADRTIHLTAEEAVKEVKKKRSYRTVAIAAVSGAIVFSALVLLVSNNTISGKLKASVFGGNSKTLYTPVAYSPLSLQENTTDKKDYVADANGIATLELDNKLIAVKAVEEVVSTIKKHSTTHHYSFTKKNFDVVLGCFSILGNANKMVNKLNNQNIAAAVNGKNEKGLFVVSGGSFNTKEEALSQLTQLKALYPNAWVKSNH